MSPKCERN